MSTDKDRDMDDQEQAIERVAKAMHDAARAYDKLSMLRSWEKEVELLERVDRIGNYVKTVRAMAHAAIDEYHKIQSDDDNWKLAGMYVDGRAVELNTVTRELRLNREDGAEV